MCVQRFDDSRDSAIHITYRISLRSSSMQEPRDPLLKVLFLFSKFYQTFIHKVFLYRILPPVGRTSSDGSNRVGKQRDIKKTKIVFQ